jgi:hypothetical protein
MSFADSYFSKQGQYLSLSALPEPDLQYAVVIPAYAEENILLALDSLWQCERTKGAVEVILVVNAPEGAPPEIQEINRKTISTVLDWSHSHREDSFRVFVVDATDLPVKHAGVGLARKTGMDEAARRFNFLNRPNGIIVSFDADCLCDDNYFTELEKASKQNPAANGFNFYFEHPIKGGEFPAGVYQGIIQYELHLRYYLQALRHSGFPYAFHTVGSCYAIKASAYIKQGGMNKRKSGEDFYFLHKIIPLGGFIEIPSARVIPSPRPSMRVPFGTGPVIQKYLQGGGQEVLTYQPELFDMLNGLFSAAGNFFKMKSAAYHRYTGDLHPLIKSYLEKLQFFNALDEINANCSSLPTFYKRFYAWFDALAVLKFLNHAGASGYPKIPVNKAVVKWLQMKYAGHKVNSDNSVLLEFFRELERKKGWVSPLPQQ